MSASEMSVEEMLGNGQIANGWSSASADDALCFEDRRQGVIQWVRSGSLLVTPEDVRVGDTLVGCVYSAHSEPQFHFEKPRKVIGIRDEADESMHYKVLLVNAGYFEEKERHCVPIFPALLIIRDEPLSEEGESVPAEY